MKITQAVNKSAFLTLVSCLALAVPLCAEIPGLLPAPSCSKVDSPLLAQTQSDLQSRQDEVVRNGKDFMRDCTSVVAGSAQDVECQRRHDALEPPKQEYTRKANAYNSDVLRVLRGCVNRLTAAVARDQHAVRNLGVDKTAEQVDEWVDWASSAIRERNEQWQEGLKESAQAILEDNLQAASDHVLDAVGSLNPPTANRLISRLRNAGVGDTLLFDAIRTVAYTPNKPEKARAAKEIIERLSQLKTVWDLEDLDLSTESAKWKAGADVISLFVIDRRLQLIGNLALQDLRFAFYSVSANVQNRISLSQIERLSTLTAVQLQALKVLSRRMVSDVQELRAAKKELASAEGQ